MLTRVRWLDREGFSLEYAYPVSFTQKDGKFWASVPDLPGCEACGENLADAVSGAQGAIETWLSEAELDGRAVPSPSCLEGVCFGPDAGAWERSFTRDE